MINRTIGNYRIVELLGSGGMGVVYRAVDQEVQRNVAIKVLHADRSTPGVSPAPLMVERFRTEARAMAKLNHPAISTLYAFFTEGEECFMVMEYVAGRNLAQLLQTHGALEWRDACDIVLRALAGVQHAHAQGIIHRDLKPANIMLGHDGSVKVTDFGIARMYHSDRLTADRGTLGTLEYLAPERLQGHDATESSDLYSMAIVLYETVVGHPPFTQPQEYQLIRAQVEAAPVPPSQLDVNLPAAVEQVLLRALAKQPGARPADAAAFIRELEEAIATLGGVAGRARGAVRSLLAAKSTVITPLPAAQPASPAAAEDAAMVQVTPSDPRPKAAAETTVVPAASVRGAPPTVVPRTIPAPANPSFSPRAANERRTSMAAWGGGMVALAAVLYFAVVWLSPTPPAGPEPAPVARPNKPASSTATPAAAPAPASVPAPVPVDPAPVAPATVPPRPPPAPDRPAPGPTTLAEVHEAFVPPLPNDFDALLIEEIRDKLKGDITVAPVRGTAETQLSIVFRDENGKTVGDLERLKGTIFATATLRNPRSKQALWTVEVNDRRGLTGGFGNKLRRMASRLAGRLRDDRKASAKRPRPDSR